MSKGTYYYITGIWIHQAAPQECLPREINSHSHSPSGSDQSFIHWLALTHIQTKGRLFHFPFKRERSEKGQAGLIFEPPVIIFRSNLGRKKQWYEEIPWVQRAVSKHGLGVEDWVPLKHLRKQQSGDSCCQVLHRDVFLPSWAMKMLRVGLDLAAGWQRKVVFPKDRRNDTPIFCTNATRLCSGLLPLLTDGDRIED